MYLRVSGEPMPDMGTFDLSVGELPASPMRSRERIVMACVGSFPFYQRE
jgi:hypothetical protein